MQNTPPVAPPSLRLALLGALLLGAAPLRSQTAVPVSVQGASFQGTSFQGTSSDAPEPAFTVVRLDAVVVSSLDGKPVARVLVTSPDRSMAAITDSQGRFSFDLRRPVPSQDRTQVFSSFPPAPVSNQAASAMSLVFSLRKPGYIGGNVTLRVPAAQTASQPGAPGPPLQLKIVPAAALTGHLDPESGDLPEPFSVQLRRKQIQDGLAVWTLMAGAPVNRRGEFRFANLQPGDYKLQAPAYDPQFPFGGSANSSSRAPDSTSGFLPTFYSNADTVAAAATIRLGAGESATANLTFRPATFYRVAIPVAGMPESAVLQVHLLFDTPGLYISRNQNTSMATGYLPNGDYDLMLVADVPVSAPSANPVPIQLSAAVHLHVSGRAVQMDPVALHPGLELPIVVRRELTNPPPEVDKQYPFSLWVNLQSLDPNMDSPQMAPMRPGLDDSGLKIENLHAGLFHVSVQPRLGYAASVTSGTTDLLREPLRVPAGSVPPPIEITLRDDFATLTIHLPPGDPAPSPTAGLDQVFLLVIPLDRPETQSFTVSWPSTAQNQYTLPQLPPGRYLALAAHRQLAQDFEFRSQDVLRDLLNQGAVVTLSPGQKADVQVPFLPEDTN